MHRMRRAWPSLVPQSNRQASRPLVMAPLPPAVRLRQHLAPAQTPLASALRGFDSHHYLRNASSLSHDTKTQRSAWFQHTMLFCKQHAILYTALGYDRHLAVAAQYRHRRGTPRAAARGRGVVAEQRGRQLRLAAGQRIQTRVIDGGLRLSARRHCQHTH